MSQIREREASRPLPPLVGLETAGGPGAGQPATLALLEAKLSPPVERAQAVVRARLLERRRPDAGRKLVLVAAPAGSGKTTLLGMWRHVEATRRPIAWLSIDEGDS